MKLLAPDVLVNTLSVSRTFGNKSKRLWQYHSRSDHHSRVACWAVLVDLLQSSRLLRTHVDEGSVVLGVNHSMRDFHTGKKKKLDLVVARPDDISLSTRVSLASLADEWAITLTDVQRAVVAALPSMYIGPVGSAVLIALEAKATMTAHVAALPRLHDELSSSHLIVHGASDRALAVGFAMVNIADQFLSPGKNKDELVWNKHRQPFVTERVLETLLEIRRRSEVGGSGFDGLAAIVVDLKNDGSQVKLWEAAPAPQPGDVMHYASMVARISHEYDSRFATV